MKIEFKQKIKRENGQIIVLFAVSLVAILVVAALAVDGGMLYAERRHTQNAADAASMAGGSAILNADMDMNTFVCPTSSTYNHGTKQFSNYTNIVAKSYLAAKDSGGLNNFPSLPYVGYIRNGTTIEDFGISSKNGIYIICESATSNKYVDIVVDITAQIKTAFAHLVFPGAVATTDEAVTRVIPGHNMGYGNAIVSLSKTCKNTTDGGTYFSGSAAKIKIKGSGTHSNSCLVGNGSHMTVSVEADEYLNLVGADALRIRQEFLTARIVVTSQP